MRVFDEDASLGVALRNRSVRLLEVFVRKLLLAGILEHADTRSFLLLHCESELDRLNILAVLYVHPVDVARKQLTMDLCRLIIL